MSDPTPHSPVDPRNPTWPAAFQWLLRLRWGASLGLVAAILVARLVVMVQLDVAPLIGLVALIAVSNALAQRARNKTQRLGAALLTMDVVVLSLLLALSGGPTNPFSVLYVVYIALAATTMGRGVTYALTGLAIAAYGALFFIHRPVAELAGSEIPRSAEQGGPRAGGHGMGHGMHHGGMGHGMHHGGMGHGHGMGAGDGMGAGRGMRHGRGEGQGDGMGPGGGMRHGASLGRGDGMGPGRRMQHTDGVREPGHARRPNDPNDRTGPEPGDDARAPSQEAEGATDGDPEAERGSASPDHDANAAAPGDAPCAGAGNDSCDGADCPAGRGSAATHAAAGAGHAGHGGGHGGHGAHGGGSYTTHLYGMFFAFSLTALLIAVFVSRLSESLRARERELMLAREREAANTRLAALTTLSAGAAHELGTPLGTIALVSKELDRRLTSAELPDEAADVQLIRAEVDRCRGILDRMAGRAGDTVGEAPTHVTVDELTSQLRERLHPDLAARVEVNGEATLHLPPTAFLQVLENLVRNALDASEDGTVTLDATTPGVIRVLDQGPGMSPEVLARAGEPFFTTKEAGHGMGLGLYLARTVVEQLGGTLDLRSEPGEGTVVSLELPT